LKSGLEPEEELVAKAGTEDAKVHDTEGDLGGAAGELVANKSNILRFEEGRQVRKGRVHNMSAGAIVGSEAGSDAIGE